MAYLTIQNDSNIIQILLSKTISYLKYNNDDDEFSDPGRTIEDYLKIHQPGRENKEGNIATGETSLLFTALTFITR